MGVQGIIGRKVGMTQIYGENGAAIPATVIEAGPCVVIQRKTAAKDGYEAAKLGLVAKSKVKRISRSVKQCYEKIGLPPCRVSREIRVDADAEFQVGDRIAVDMFTPGDSVNITGVSKGKGFQGVIRRHGFSGGAKSHGSMFHRAPGSIGASAYPSRVLKGMKAAGHMGDARITVGNLKVERIDVENNLLIVRGAVPGAAGGYLIIIRKSGAPLKG
ncbi:MAG: 50S ribosomal protein L3 [Vicinamibacteria bacterium]|nr:50S ribosomal protein L3 [Vicinamibacteria bacterium]